MKQINYFTIAVGFFMLFSFGCNAGRGVNRISDASSSVQDAKNLRVFISDVRLSALNESKGKQQFQVIEAWFENIIDRQKRNHESVCGQRLCLKVEFNGTELPASRSDIKLTPLSFESPNPGSTHSSGKSVVISVYSYDDQDFDFPRQGQIAITNFKGEKTFSAYEFSEAESGTQTGNETGTGLVN